MNLVCYSRDRRVRRRDELLKTIGKLMQMLATLRRKVGKF